MEVRLGIFGFLKPNPFGQIRPDSLRLVRNWYDTRLMRTRSGPTRPSVQMSSLPREGPKHVYRRPGRRVAPALSEPSCCSRLKIVCCTLGSESGGTLRGLPGLFGAEPTSPMSVSATATIKTSVARAGCRSTRRLRECGDTVVRRPAALPQHRPK
jgi:hypothetical protein